LGRNSGHAMVDFAKNEYGRHSDGAASDGLYSSFSVRIQAAGERGGEAQELTEWPSHPLHTSRHSLALRVLNAIGAIADNAGLAVGSTRLRMTQIRKYAEEPVGLISGAAAFFTTRTCRAVLLRKAPSGGPSHDR